MTNDWNPSQPKLSELVRRDPVAVDSRALTSVSQGLKRKVDNLVLRVPPTDWAEVVIGVKRMYRMYHPQAGRPEQPMVPLGIEVPRPVLLWSRQGSTSFGGGRTLTVPAVLLEHRFEPLGAISAGDLEAEGFPFLPGFRFQWKKRYPRMGWRPWSMVNVFRVRPWTDEDDEWAGQWLVNQLYGDWRQ